MTKILGISGSLRAGSWNTRLLHAARAAAPAGIELAVATLHGIPLYDGDVEEGEGAPAAVAALKARIVASDGVILVTPEYNHGIPGVFKNAIDWLSRPPADAPRVFADRPFAVIGASSGGFGTVQAQAAWLPVLQALGTRHWAGGRLLVSKAHEAFSPEGAPNAALRGQLVTFVEGFAAFAARPA